MRRHTMSGTFLIASGLVCMLVVASPASDRPSQGVAGRVLSDAELAETHGALRGPCVSAGSCQRCSGFYTPCIDCTSILNDQVCLDLIPCSTCTPRTIPGGCGNVKSGGTCIPLVGLDGLCTGGTITALPCVRTQCFP